MDIRKFLNKRKETTGTDEVVDQTSKQQRLLLAEKDNQNPAPSSQGDCITPSISGNTPDKANEYLKNENDIGLYLNKNKLSKLSQTDKLNILTKPLKLHKNYNFKADVAEKQRPFVYSWMEKYSPWLAYSECEKGALCLYCVMFPQPVRRGVQGAFIVRPFSKYRQFHDEANDHLLTQWHRNAAEDASNFIRLCNKPEENISSQINSNYRITIERNREKLSSLLKRILFCGMHDIALRGKEVDSGNLFDLYKFRAEAEDEVLQKHLESAPKNARYTSVQTQNELIELSADVLREKIVLQANASIAGFSLIADETTDFSGIEQLSTGIRYVESCEGNIVIHEEFLRFSSLNAMNAEAISKAILNKTEEYGLDMQKLIGQGYDGCSTMAGEVSGIQKRIRELYPKAYFMHCASHRLNLVINDQNKVRNSQCCRCDQNNYCLFS